MNLGGFFVELGGTAIVNWQSFGFPGGGADDLFQFSGGTALTEG
jgi:hypothetical protein